MPATRRVSTRVDGSGDDSDVQEVVDPGGVCNMMDAGRATAASEWFPCANLVIRARA